MTGPNPRTSDGGGVLALLATVLVVALLLAGAYTLHQVGPDGIAAKVARWTEQPATAPACAPAAAPA